MLSAVVLSMFGSLSAPAACADAPPTPPPARPLGALERSAGWHTLFDGESLAGWAAVDGGSPERSGGWRVADGCLHLRAGGGGGALFTTRSYGEFELEFDWCVAPGGNSGVKVRTDAERSGAWAYGPEYQVLDDNGHANGTEPLHEAGALYDLVAPERKAERAGAGAWYRGRIVAREGRLEHWLDGVRVVDVALEGPGWKAALAASKFAGNPGFGQGAGPIALQDHGDAVWFANLRIRDWADMPGEFVDLLAGEELAGWRALGDARYVREGDEILGEVDGGGQSFLVTQREFGDFVFEVDVKNELPGNSGIQVRSHVREDGRLFGYQIEIDMSERAWSGGLYDEGRRGWLDNLEGDEAARAAFRDREWNRYRIECIGPWIRAWVNGVPTADHIDPLDLSGVFGLQVHSGNNTRVRWRRPRLWDLGTRSWEELEFERLAWAIRWHPDHRPHDTDWIHGRTSTSLQNDGCVLRIRSTDLQPLIARFGLSPLAPWKYEDSTEPGPILCVNEDGGVNVQLPASESPRDVRISIIGNRATLHVDGELVGSAKLWRFLWSNFPQLAWLGGSEPRLACMGDLR